VIAAFAVLLALLVVSITLNVFLGIALREYGGERARALAASTRQLLNRKPPTSWPPRAGDGAA
jgi:hypothetical protein